MLRKVTNVHGGKAKVIMLPKKWTDKFGIGREVNVTSKGNSLIIKNPAPVHEQMQIINLNTENKNRIIRTIRSLYKDGVRHARINYSKEYVVCRDGNKHSTFDLIMDTVSQLEGFIITKKGKRFVEISCVANDTLFDNALKRAFFMLIEMSTLVNDSLITGNIQLLEEARSLYPSLQKLTDYCSRALNSRDIEEVSSTINISVTADSIEEIANIYRHIAKHFNDEKPSRRIKEISEHTHEIIRLMYDIFYDSDNASLERYYYVKVSESFR